MKKRHGQRGPDLRTSFGPDGSDRVVHESFSCAGRLRCRATDREGNLHIPSAPPTVHGHPHDVGFASARRIDSSRLRGSSRMMRLAPERPRACRSPADQVASDEARFALAASRSACPRARTASACARIRLCHLAQLQPRAGLPSIGRTGAPGSIALPPSSHGHARRRHRHWPRSSSTVCSTEGQVGPARTDLLSALAKAALVPPPASRFCFQRQGRDRQVRVLRLQDLPRRAEVDTRLVGNSKALPHRHGCTGAAASRSGWGNSQPGPPAPGVLGAQRRLLGRQIRVVQICLDRARPPGSGPRPTAGSGGEQDQASCRTYPHSAPTIVSPRPLARRADVETSEVHRSSEKRRLKAPETRRASPRTIDPVAAVRLV